MTTCGAASVLQIAKDALILGVGILLVYNGEILIGDLVAVLQLAAIIAAPIELLAYLLHSRNAVLPLLKQLEDLSSKQAGEEKPSCPELFSVLCVDGRFVLTGGVLTER
ncbi:MAG: hypothetical protein K2N78_05510 [Oscillospiraceae bacterium]|nr:hypothetical protein [Oscillospiraceae bacterium]